MAAKTPCHSHWIRCWHCKFQRGWWQNRVPVLPMPWYHIYPHWRMLQSDVYRLTVEADPWETMNKSCTAIPHVHIARWSDFSASCYTSNSLWWYFPGALFKLQWDVVQGFPEQAMGVSTSDSSWKIFLPWIGLIISFNNLNFVIHNIVWQWFPGLAIQCFKR